MTSYLKSLARRKQKETALEILWEVAESFAEADPGSPAHTLPKARKLHDLVRFVKFDGVAPWLRDERDVVKRVLAFARKIKDKKLSDILASALEGIPQPPAIIRVGLPRQTPQAIDIDRHIKELGIDLNTKHDGKDWGGTDIALSFSMDKYEAAVLEELIKAADDFDLQPPIRLQREAKAKRLRAKATKGHTVTALFLQLVATKKPRMEVGAWEDAESREYGNGVHINIKHALNPPATRQELAKAQKQYGPAAEDLLEIYALHNGGELFQYRKKSGFMLAPIAHWAELHAHAVEWAEMAWPKEDIPSYFYTAIAFGQVPGDCYCWLLITEGKYAGSIMYSDTDSIEEPSFKNMHDFLASMLHDARRILQIGGHVQYNVKGEWLFPMRYIFDEAA